MTEAWIKPQEYIKPEKVPLIDNGSAPKMPEAEFKMGPAPDDKILQIKGDGKIG